MSSKIYTYIHIYIHRETYEDIHQGIYTHQTEGYKHIQRGETTEQRERDYNTQRKVM